MEPPLPRIFKGDNVSDPLSELNFQTCLLALEWFVGSVSEPGHQMCIVNVAWYADPFQCSALDGFCCR